MTDEIQTLLARHLPGYEVRSVRALGEGLNNAVREVNGELIVRTSEEADPALGPNAPGARRTCWRRWPGGRRFGSPSPSSLTPKPASSRTSSSRDSP